MNKKMTGFESGADAYVPKPFNATLLNTRIRKLIEGREKLKETFGNILITDSPQSKLADKEQDFIDGFKKYIEEHLSDPDLCVDDIARSLNMSRVQLYRKIKSSTDSTPNELIKIIRLKYAKQLFSGNDYSISEVAFMAGFSSPSYFTKCFKEVYQENPSDYISS